MTTAIRLSPSPTRVKAWPGLRGGLLVGGQEGACESFGAYRGLGGYEELLRPGSTYETLQASASVRHLHGRGGAAYPYWRKLEYVRRTARTVGKEPVVAANGAEGEPLSVKDRYLMRHRPHLVLDGLALTAAAMGAREAYVYVADQLSRDSMRRAVADAAGFMSCSVSVVEAQDTYVAGESSALVRSVDHGIGRPTDGPPHPRDAGIGKAPTMVANVETLARVARAVQSGSTAEEIFLLTVSGPSGDSVLVEAPKDTRVLDLLDWAGFVPVDGRPLTLLAGGFFGGIVPADDDLRMSWGSFTDHGGALGCASLYVIDEPGDIVPVAADVATYYAHNTAEQCRSCMGATRDITHHLTAEAPPTGHVRSLGGDPKEELARWSTQLIGRGACAVPDGVALLLRSLLQHYPVQLEEHLVRMAASRSTAARSPVPAVEWRSHSASKAASIPEVGVPVPADVAVPVA